MNECYYMNVFCYCMITYIYYVNKRPPTTHACEECKTNSVRHRRSKQGGWGELDVAH